MGLKRRLDRHHVLGRHLKPGRDGFGLQDCLGMVRLPLLQGEEVSQLIACRRATSETRRLIRMRSLTGVAAQRSLLARAAAMAARASSQVPWGIAPMI